MNKMETKTLNKMNNFFVNRRTRSTSENEPEPVKFKRRKEPPPVPEEEIYQPSHLDHELDDIPEEHRARGATIGNCNLRSKRNILIMEAAKNARKRREEKKLIPTVFRFTGSALSKGSDVQVFVTGTMTDWKCVEMTRPVGESDFIKILDCNEGPVFYRFNVNGVWKHDFKQKTTKPREHCSSKLWNVLLVQKTDNDVFEALACDSFSLRDKREASGSQNDGDRHDDDKWCQDKPPQSFINKHKGPPLLPPHLLQVLLNRDVPYTTDPVLLPEPSHVTLDHLYAQSIKDNMLVLSSTTRYRRKCVTVVLYRPV